MGRKKSYCMVGPPGRINVTLHNVVMYRKRKYQWWDASTKADYEKDLAAWTKDRCGTTTSTPAGVVPTSGLFGTKKKATGNAGSAKE